MLEIDLMAADRHKDGLQEKLSTEEYTSSMTRRKASRMPAKEISQTDGYLPKKMKSETGLDAKSWNVLIFVVQFEWPC